MNDERVMAFVQYVGGKAVADEERQRGKGRERKRASEQRWIALAAGTSSRSPLKISLT